MSELKDIFGKRKHPNIYSDKIIPTENDIRDIVTQAYPLVTSFRKAFAYEIHVLGPDKKRSNESRNYGRYVKDINKKLMMIIMVIMPYK